MSYTSRKRGIALAWALIASILFAMTAPCTKAEVKAATPPNVTSVTFDETTGVAKGTVSGDGVLYCEVYGDGKHVASMHFGTIDGDKDAGREYIYDNLNEYLMKNGSGTYTCYYVFCANDQIRDKLNVYDGEAALKSALEANKDDLSYKTATISYTKPDKQLAVPANLHFEDKGDGYVLLAFDEVEGAARYFIYHEDYDAAGNRTNGDGKSWYTSEKCNYLIDWPQNTRAKVKLYVKAVSGNVQQYMDSEVSEPIEYTKGDVIKAQEKVLDIINNADNDSAKVEAAEKLVSDEVKIDDIENSIKANEAAQTNYKAIDDAYKASKNITVNATTGGTDEMAANKVSIVGAAMNVPQNSTVSVTLAQTPTSTVETTTGKLDPDVYKNVVAFDINVTDASGNEILTTDAKTPMLVTLPIPAGKSYNNLTVLHYRNDNKFEIIKPIKIDTEAGTFTIMIRHFSTFAVVDYKEPVTSSDGTASGTSSSNSNVENETSVDIKTWKPTTPEEIRRYNAVGKGAVSFIKAATNAYDLTAANAMQGPMCFVSFDAVRGDYQIGRTYNIYPTGQKGVYHMDKPATITLNIPADLQAAGRDFKMICVTKDGLPIILNDQDKNATTITITTSDYYAFALIYK